MRKENPKYSEAQQIFFENPNIRVIDLADRVGVPRTTVSDWVKCFRAESTDCDVDESLESRKYLKHEPYGTFKYGQEIDSEFGGHGEVELKLNENKITKVVVLSDIHFPYNIDLRAVFDFISDFGPRYVILNGDIADWDCFSPHLPSSKTPALKFVEHKQFCLGLIKQLEALGDFDISWINGNHEDWCRQACLPGRNPELQGLIEPHSWLPEHVSFVPLNYCVKVGKLRVFHGNCLRGQGVRGIPDKMFAQWSDGHLLFGHYHTHASSTQPRQIGAEARYSLMSPCLCNINPAYSRNTPNAVTNGFYQVVLEPDGNIWPTPHFITNGKFNAEGKLYEA